MDMLNLRRRLLMACSKKHYKITLIGGYDSKNKGTAYAIINGTKYFYYDLKDNSITLEIEEGTAIYLFIQNNYYTTTASGYIKRQLQNNGIINIDGTTVATIPIAVNGSIDYYWNVDNDATINIETVHCGFTGGTEEIHTGKITITKSS